MSHQLLQFLHALVTVGAIALAVVAYRPLDDACRKVKIADGVFAYLVNGFFAAAFAICFFGPAIAFIYSWFA